VLGLTKAEWSLGAVAVAANGMTNGSLPPKFHVPIGLLASAVSSYAFRADVTMREQGLALRALPRGTLYGTAASIPIAATLIFGARNKHSRPMYAEERITAVSGQRAAYEMLIRIPLGTALPEEIIFRGSLLGLLLRHHPTLIAAALDSFLFGLWHVTPTLSRMPTHGLTKESTIAFRCAWLAVTVGATFVSGLALSWLRLRSGSIVAPWMAHTTANCAGYALTRFYRRSRSCDANAPVAGTTTLR
jgi:membrane protease YdiL (CAAX protease family)